MGDKHIEDVSTSARKRPLSGIRSFTEQIKNWVGPVIKRYFRAEVHGVDSMPSTGGALVVSNHSGGMFTRCARLRTGVLRPVRLSPSALHPCSLRGIHWTAVRVAAPRWRHRGQRESAIRRCAQGRRAGVSVVTMTHTGRRSPRTRSTSVAGPDTSGLPSRRVADRADGVDRCTGITAASSPAVTHWPGGWV